VGPPVGVPPDAGVDAPVDPASVVTVTVTLDGAPRQGVVVYIQSSNLGPSTELRTDAKGSAMAPLTGGFYDIGSVTVINPFGPINATTDELLTYNGVKLGDHIAVARASRPPSVSFTVVAPSYTPAAKRYLLHTSCGAVEIAPNGAHVGGAVTLQGCGSAIDTLVEALDDAGHSLSWLYNSDVAVRNGETIVLTGAYLPSGSKTFSYHTESIDRPQLEIHARLLTAKGIVYESPAQVIPVSYMDEYPSLTFALPSIPGAVSVTETIYQAGDNGLEHMVEWGPDSDRYELDLEALGHSFLEEFYSVPTFVGGVITYTWHGGHLADYMRTRLSATRAGERSWEWQFVSPPLPFGGGAQAWPVIPSNVYPYNRTAGDVWSLQDTMLVHGPGGYDAIRARALSIPDPLAQLTGPAGRLVYETVLPE